MKVDAEKIRKVIADTKVISDMAKLADDMKFSDVGVDSLDEFNIYLAIEETYGIKIPDSDVDGLGSIAAVVAYLEGKSQ